MAVEFCGFMLVTCKQVYIGPHVDAWSCPNLLAMALGNFCFCITSVSVRNQPHVCHSVTDAI